MKNLSIIILVGFLTSSFAKVELVDYIAATVDGEIILQSDVMAAVQQLKSTPSFNSLSGEALRSKVLDQLIDSKILLAKAKKDTLKIPEAELTERVESHIAMLQQQQHLTAEMMEKALLAQMGMTMPQFKAKLTEQIREQSMMQKLRGKYVSGINPTPKDVQTFFAEYKDSLPKQFDAWKVSHIQKKISPLSSQIDSVRKIADSIVNKLDKGENFERLVEKYSQDPISKIANGDLGFLKKGTLEPEFERVAFWLEQGQYSSNPVYTKLGWHIIKILAKKDTEIRPAHILLSVKPTTQDSARSKNLLDSLKKGALATNFSSLASQFSDDKKSNQNNGVLGWFSRGELDPKYAQIVSSLSVGSISEPVLIEDAWHIFKLDEKKEERNLTLEEDWDKIQNFCINIQSERKLQSLTKKWRSEFQVTIRKFKSEEVFP